MLETQRPGVLFEDKVLYTQRMFDAGQADESWGFEEASARPPGDQRTAGDGDAR